MERGKRKETEQRIPATSQLCQRRRFLGRLHGQLRRDILSIVRLHWEVSRLPLMHRIMSLALIWEEGLGEMRIDEFANTVNFEMGRSSTVESRGWRAFVSDVDEHDVFMIKRLPSL